MTDLPAPFAVEPLRDRPDGPPPSYGVPAAGGSAWRIEPESVLAWRDMPTATRWRFRA